MRVIIALATGAALILGADGALARAASSHKAASSHAGNAAMKSCAAQWREMKKAGTAKGTYQDFSKTCMSGKGAGGSTAATVAAPETSPTTTPAPAATPKAKSSPKAGPPKAATVTPAPGTEAAAATAKCKDGTYSHAKTHSGACSGHGGVAQWFK